MVESAYPQALASAPDLMEWLERSASVANRVQSPVLKQKVVSYLDQLFQHLSELEELSELSLLIAIDGLAIGIDQIVASAVGGITSHADFQELYSHWLGVAQLSEAANGDSRVEIHIMNASKEDLLEDFNDACDTTGSGLFQRAYTSEYDQSGGMPFTSILLHYNFDNTGQDLTLLGYIAQVAASCHAPAIGNVDYALLGVHTAAELEELDPVSLFKESRYTRWNGFRQREDARYIGLALPRFRVVRPHRADLPRYCRLPPLARADYAWIPASYAFGVLLINSFIQKGWCAHLRGSEGGGLLPQLPAMQMGNHHFHFVDSPLEVNLSDRLEQNLAAQGLISFIYSRHLELPCLYNAPSLQRREAFDNNPAASLPYLYLVARFAHCQKVMQREHIGSAQNADDLELLLEKWLHNYISPTPTSSQVRLDRPLKSGRVKVTMEPDDPGYYQVSLTVQPHLQMEGIDTRLSLASKIRR